VITATAQALGGTTTQNYTGSLMRLTNASLTGRSYTPTPASPALSLTGLPATSSDPTIVDQGAGVSTLTFSAGTGISFVRGSAIAPFAANIALAINVIDLDSITATNPVTFGAVTGISFSTGANQYYGRMVVNNAVGSELLDLPVSLTTQYYTGTAQGFSTNTADVCTAPPTISFSAYQGSLAAGETCVRDSGSPGASGAGCAAPAALGIQFRAAPLAGDFNLNLAGPGAGNSGTVTVTASTLSWLRYVWNAGTGVTTNPSALASFGIYPGPKTRIYQREVY
jgi:MSHA biogenesis protein MshQ